MHQLPRHLLLHQMEHQLAQFSKSSVMPKHGLHRDLHLDENGCRLCVDREHSNAELDSLLVLLHRRHDEVVLI